MIERKQSFLSFFQRGSRRQQSNGSIETDTNGSGSRNSNIQGHQGDYLESALKSAIVKNIHHQNSFCGVNANSNKVTMGSHTHLAQYNSLGGHLNTLNSTSPLNNSGLTPSISIGANERRRYNSHLSLANDAIGSNLVAPYGITAHKVQSCSNAVDNGHGGSRYTKVSKANTFRTRFIKYNKPSRSKSEHVSRQDKLNQKNAVSTSDLAHAVDDSSQGQYFTNLLLKFNDTATHKSHHTENAIADLKSNFYISTNNLADGQSQQQFHNSITDSSSNLQKTYSEYTKKLLQMTPRDVDMNKPIIYVKNKSASGGFFQRNFKNKSNSSRNKELDSIGNTSNEKEGKSLDKFSQGDTYSRNKNLSHLGVANLSSSPNNKHMDYENSSTERQARQNKQFLKYVQKLKRRLTNAALKGSNMSLSKQTSERDRVVCDNNNSHSSGIVDPKNTIDDSDHSSPRGYTKNGNHYSGRYKNPKLLHSSKKMCHSIPNLNSEAAKNIQIEDAICNYKYKHDNKDYNTIQSCPRTTSLIRKGSKSQLCDSNNNYSLARLPNASTRRHQLRSNNHLSSYGLNRKDSDNEKNRESTPDDNYDEGIGIDDENSESYYRRHTTDKYRKEKSLSRKDELSIENGKNIEKKSLNESGHISGLKSQRDTTSLENEQNDDKAVLNNGASTSQLIRKVSKSPPPNARKCNILTFSNKQLGGKLNSNYVKRSVTSISAKGDTVRTKYGLDSWGLNNPYGEVIVTQGSKNDLSNTKGDTGKYNHITKLYSSRNFIRERLSPKHNNAKDNDNQEGHLTAHQISEKIKREIEVNQTVRTTQQLNLLMNKTMKWVMTQDFQKYRVIDVAEHKMNDDCNYRL